MKTDEQLFSEKVKRASNIMQFFEYSHLPEHLQWVSIKFKELAEFVNTLPEGAERSVALRKLLEAKDAAVRARLATTESDDEHQS